MKRVILATGGTGGHIFPALAVAEAILQSWPKAEILFVGGTYGQEADIIARAGYKFAGLPVRGVTGLGFKAVGAAFGMGYGILKAVTMMRRFKPQVVMGFGGYASFAGVLAAKLCGIPTAIHEQNAFPGRSNRILGKLVNKVFLSFPDKDFFPVEKSVLVGNPVRTSIINLYEEKKAFLYEEGSCSPCGAGPTSLPDRRDPEKIERRCSNRQDRRKTAQPVSPSEESRLQAIVDRRKSLADRRVTQQVSLEGRLRARQRFLELPFSLVAKVGKENFAVPRNMPALRQSRAVYGRHLLILGGSLGARGLNSAILEIMPQLSRIGIEVWHQTGSAQYEELRKAYRDAGFGCVRVDAFIEKMDQAYAWADFAVCRAGGSTIAEIATAGVPAVLVPFPFATHDHQLYNAKSLVGAGAAELLEQKNIQPPAGDSQELADIIIALSMDGQRLREMSRRALMFAMPEASRQMAQGLENLSAKD